MIINNISIKIAGRNILNAIKYRIMALKISDPQDMIHNQDDRLTAEEITTDNFMQCQGGKTTNSLLANLMKNNPKNFIGFLYYDKDLNCVGYVWLLVGGGEDGHFRLKNFPSYIDNIFIYPQFRNHGYSYQILNHVINVLRDLEKESVSLVCKDDNKTALHVYERYGFTVIKTKWLIKFLRKILRQIDV